MNINDEDKQICSTLIETTNMLAQIYHLNGQVNIQRLNIKFSNSSNNWLNLRRFALKAQNPDGRMLNGGLVKRGSNSKVSG